MVLCCFSSEPLNDDELKGKYGSKYAQYNHIQDNKFDISMCQAPTREPGVFCISILCFCPIQICMRKKALNHMEPGSGWDNYVCCQNEFGSMCCFQPGQMGERECPIPCMCLESCCCPGMAVSATNGVIRNHYSLGLDKDDIRIIRCNNCIQAISCFANVLDMCVDDEEGSTFDVVVTIINLIADISFCCVSGCMTAQVNHEIDMREKSLPSAPMEIEMTR